MRARRAAWRRTPAPQSGTTERKSSRQTAAAERLRTGAAASHAAHHAAEDDVKRYKLPLGEKEGLWKLQQGKSGVLRAGVRTCLPAADELGTPRI